MQNSPTFKYINEARFKSLFNWSVGSILGNKLHYKEGFSLEPIGNLIVRNRTKEIIEDEKFYKQVTIKLYGKGVIQRGNELIQGKLIGTKNQFRISEGQFIMSKIDARNGAFGIVPKELEGAITTQDFLSYNINTDKILPDFFNLVTTTEHFAKLCQRASSGTTGRQRVHEKDFLNFKIPVPDKQIQVDLLDMFTKLINNSIEQEQSVFLAEMEMQKLITKSLEFESELIKSKNNKFKVIPYSKLSTWDKFFTTGARKQLKISSKYDSKRIKDIASITMGISPNSNYFNLHDGIPFIGGASELQDTGIKISRYTTKPSALSNKDDIIICVRATIGKIAWSDKQYCLGRGVAAIKLTDKNILPEYFFEILNFLEDDLQRFGTGSTFKQVSKNTIESFLIPIPTPTIQEEILQEIKRIKTNIYEHKNLSIENRNKAHQIFESAIFNTDDEIKQYY